MKKNPIALWIFLSALVTISVHSQEKEPAKKSEIFYKTLFRHEVDALGGMEKDEISPSSHEHLSKALNRLAREGWELVAVEGGRSIPGAGVQIFHHPIYIFKKITGSSE